MQSHLIFTVVTAKQKIIVPHACEKELQELLQVQIVKLGLKSPVNVK